MDMETDNLRKDLTCMHCFVARLYEDNVFIKTIEFTEVDVVVQFLKAIVLEDYILCGHNIVKFDIPVITDLTGYVYTGTVWDTLAMSYKLFPDQKEHGLEYYGNKYKVPKPKIADWKNLTREDYLHRCRIDVEINSILFGNLYSYFEDIYYPESPNKDLAYITWKMDCAREQEENPIKIDVNLVKRTLEEVNRELEKREKDLSAVMPKVNKYKTVAPPKSILKKDGDLSVAGEKWLDLLQEKGLPKDHNEPIKVIASVSEPNPGSSPQLKEWLFSLGWEPTTFKTSISKVTKKAKEVPQIQTPEKELCDNIKDLIHDHPNVGHLKGFFMIKHRKGVFEAFLEMKDSDDFLIASLAGFTNTMRFKHRKPIANMPGVKKAYGKQIRGSLIARDKDHLFCGSDMSSLEDSTKQHYMFFYDPEYVKQMRVPGFDPHIDIAVFAELLTKEEEIVFKKLKKKLDNDEKLTASESEVYEYLSAVRSNSKTVNFAGVYGAGPPKIAKTLRCSLEFATNLHTAYWIRNKAVKQVEKDTIYKSVRKQLWLWNPVAEMWYYLKHTKDIFSTLNQGTGVYCFDSWLKEVRACDIKIMLQYHDELGFDFHKDDREIVREALLSSIEKVNDKLKLNVPLGISIDIGNNYGEAH